MCSLTAQDVANYFLANVDVESGDNITHLKLQKLLYYAQGFHIAMQGGDALFPERIVAWKHGPVVRRLWSAYKCWGWHPIDPIRKQEPGTYAPEVEELLSAVNEIYGQFTATRLEQMTHDESPWQRTKANHTIRVGLLQEYFGEMVEAGRQGAATEGHPVWPTNSFRHQRRNAISERMDAHREKLRAIAARNASSAR